MACPMRDRAIHLTWMMAFVAAFASLGAVAMQPRASLSGALPNNTCCARFSPNKIDYADSDVLVVPNVMNESVCCSLCAAHNANRPHNAPASTNCTIAVWHGPGTWTCHLKATASKPFDSTLVVAVQPLPPPPPPVPVRFASIYTDHAVLQSSPHRAVVWGFANVDGPLTVRLDDGAEVPATLQPLPPGTPYTDRWLWRAVLPPTAPSWTAHSVTVAGVGCNASIHDILFGDVYVCGGQSNMEYSINGSNGGTIKHPPINNSLAEIATMRRPELQTVRMIRAGHSAPPDPALELPDPAQGGEPFGPVLGWTPPCFDDPHSEGAENAECRVDMSAVCWLFGRNLHYGLTATGRPTPIGLIESCWSGSPDEAWSTAASLQRCGLDAHGDGGMFNGMIRPLLNTTIKGAIWYQGEEDASHPAGVGGYNCTFPSMVDAWRSAWFAGTGETDPQFPFGFVQLNSMGNGTVYNNPSGEGNLSSPFTPGFAGLRWSQTSGHGSVPNPAQPNTYMAVSYDTPDRPVPYPINGKPGADPGFNVHSPFKQPTAARLARAALATVYNVTVDTVGPFAGHVTRTNDGHGLVIAIEQAGSGVAPLRSQRGFEVLSKGQWMSVPAVSTTSNTVTISPVPADSTKLRYNWYTNPCGYDCFTCAVYVNVQTIGNWSGELPFLPLPPFFTDL
eukprot:m.192856 g.192856  ORF g.192856 m.192856 type:complete len:675 (-) comp18757_c0_seq1:153-2177(-)